jgi:hypothetical protein
MIMRNRLLLLIMLLWTFHASAQEDRAYQTALARIRAAQASNATELDLSYLALSELPPEIGSLINLQVLDLRNNQLRSLPPEMSSLIYLQVLALEGNPLEFPPPEVLAQDMDAVRAFLRRPPPYGPYAFTLLIPSVLLMVVAVWGLSMAVWLRALRMRYKGSAA